MWLWFSPGDLRVPGSVLVHDRALGDRGPYEVKFAPG